MSEELTPEKKLLREQILRAAEGPNQRNGISAEELKSILSGNSPEPNSQQDEGIVSLMKDASRKLHGDLSYLGFPYPAEKLSKYFIAPSNKKAATLGKNDIFVLADTHGNYTDFNAGIQFLTERLTTGEDVQLVLLGDYLHGLKVETMKEGNRVLIPAYKDDSLKILSELFKLREILGDRIIPLLGDHELSSIFPSFKIAKKYQTLTEDQTNVIANQLTAEQKEYVKRELLKFPIAARTQNGIIFAHAGAAPLLDNWDQLENLVLQEPGTDRIKWANESIEGRLLLGKYKEVERNGKKISMRTITYEEVKQFLKKCQGRLLATGHNGIAEFIHERDGKQRTYNGTGGMHMLDLENQITLVTTENSDYAKKRDSKGINHYGKVFCVEGGKPYKFIHYTGFPDLPKNSFNSYELAENALQDLSEKDLFERVKQSLHVNTARNAIPHYFKTFFEGNEEGVMKALADEKLKEKLSSAAEKLEMSDAKNIVRQGLSGTDYLRRLGIAEEIDWMFLK